MNQDHRWKLAYTITEAAEACGVSHDVIRRAIAKGSIVARYPTARPVIPVDELRDWIESAPTERRRSA
jgi:excisionase family DNA binding protein